MDLKERLINYIKSEGVKYSFIASKLGVHRAILSMFVRDTRNLTTTTAIKLDSYLTKKNY